jgi:hypothetical protein
MRGHSEAVGSACQSEGKLQVRRRYRILLKRLDDS